MCVDEPVDSQCRVSFCFGGCFLFWVGDRVREERFISLLIINSINLRGSTDFHSQELDTIARCELENESS